MSIATGSSHRENRNDSNTSPTSNEIVPIGIKFPIRKSVDNSDTFFEMNYNIRDQINDNLKNLIMTRKGERLGFFDYGTSIHELYSQEKSDEEIMSEVMGEISLAVAKYMRGINLENFYSLESIDDINLVSNSILKNKITEYYNSQENMQLTNTNISVNSNDNQNRKLYVIAIEYVIPGITPEGSSESLILSVRSSRWEKIYDYYK